MPATIVSQFSLKFFVHKENEHEMSVSAVCIESAQSRQSNTDTGH